LNNRKKVDVGEIVQNRTRNILLRQLSAEDFQLIQPYLKRVQHSLGTVVAEPGQPIRSVAFPEGGISALLSVMRDGTRLAVGLIGLEGFVGASLLHGARDWRHEVLVRATDTTAVVMDADRLLDACGQSRSLQDLLLRFAGYFQQQVGRTSVCNLSEPLERRMARWILLYHDRLEGDEIAMTHQEISIMLGVRRASATDVLHILEGEHAIRGTRGCILVRDRRRLEELAGENYGEAEEDYRRLIAPFGKSAGPLVQPAAQPIER
jgi:CRP-like cAMP-binding protein